MKVLNKFTQRFTLLAAGAMLTIAGFAQETKKIDIDINTKGSGADAGNFFTQPWVWIVGGAIFILLLVALMRGNSKSE